MKHILVLGAAGFIGSALCKRLAADGDDVTGVDIRPVPPGLGCAHRYSIDLRDHAPLPEKFDEVYQLAADVGGAGYLADSHDAEIMASNVAINHRVSQWAARCGTLVFASSACVYGHMADQPFLEASSWAVPDTAYGKEKLFAEDLYRACAERGDFKFRAARLGTVYGPGEPTRGPRTHLVGRLCHDAAQHRPGPLSVWGDGTSTRSMTFIDDAVAGLIALARFETPDTLRVNIAGPVETVGAIAICIAGLADRMAWFMGASTNKGPIDLTVNTDLARTRLGWTAAVSSKEGLLRTYDWVKASAA